jgi:methionyl-tRNA synthetase
VTIEEDIAKFADRCGPEALRYYLMRDCSVGGDMDFTDDRLLSRYATDLGNSIGNLLNRSLNMANKYRAGRLVRQAVSPGPSPDAFVETYTTSMDENRVHSALEAAVQFATACNQYIDTEKPFSLAADPAQADKLDAVLYTLTESLRIIAILISPVLPRAAAEIFAQLGVSAEPRLADAKWGGLADGHQLGNPTPLFPRIEQEKPAA